MLMNQGRRQNLLKTLLGVSLKKCLQRVLKFTNYKNNTVYLRDNTLTTVCSFIIVPMLRKSVKRVKIKTFFKDFN